MSFPIMASSFPCPGLVNPASQHSVIPAHDAGITEEV